MKKIISVGLFALLLLANSSVYAATADLAAKRPASAASHKEGWAFNFKLGANLGWNFSQSYVGVPDGHALNLGGQAQAQTEFNAGKHEWRNSLTLLATFGYAPPLNQFLKSADNLSFESIYLYHLLPWLGPYGMVKLRTSMFAGQDTQVNDVDYVISDIANPGAATQTIRAKQLALTMPFAPLVLEQQIGFFAQAVESKPINVEFRVAGSMRETIADGQKVVTGTTTAGGATTVTVQKTTNVYEAGPAVGVSVNGMVLQDKLSYTLRCDAMLPLLQTPVSQQVGNVFEKTVVEAMAGLSFHLFEWMSLDWQFKAIRQPIIIDKFQLLSNLLLTFSYSI